MKKNIRWEYRLKNNLMMGDSYNKNSLGEKDFIVTGQFHNEPSGIKVIMLCSDSKTKKCFIMNEKQNRFGWVDLIELERIIIK
jgi:hypothetical protein